MNIISRFLNRHIFKRSITKDESFNVVNGMVKARVLYKELSYKAHPDRNPGKREIAEDIFKRVEANKFNYSELQALNEEIRNTLSI